MHYEQGLDAGTYCDWFARCWECGLYIWRARLRVIVTAAEIEAEMGRQRRTDPRSPCITPGCLNTYRDRQGANGRCPKCNEVPRGLRRRRESKGICSRCGKGPVNLRKGLCRKVCYNLSRGIAPGDIARTYKKGTCSECGRPNVTIAVQHPVPLCGVCKSLSRGLTAGGRKRK